MYFGISTSKASKLITSLNLGTPQATSLLENGLLPWFVEEGGEGGAPAGSFTTIFTTSLTT